MSQQEPDLSSLSNRQVERFIANQRRQQRTASNRKQFIRVNYDGTLGQQAIVAASPARAAAKAFRGGGDQNAFLIVETDPNGRQRGPGVHKYSVQFRTLNDEEIARDQFLRHGNSSIRQRKKATRLQMNEEDVKLGLAARDRVQPSAQPPVQQQPERTTVLSHRTKAPKRNVDVARRQNPFPSVG